MAWDAINLRTDRGLPVSEADREIILSAAEKALLRGDQDPSIVIRAAERVSRKLHVVENLRAYASRAMSAALHRAAREQGQREPSVCQRDPEGFPDLNQRDDIEKRVFVRELLESLPSQDREILLRKVWGDSGAEIERDLNLKPRTAETRFRAARTALRKLIADKLDNQTRTRGR